MGDEQSEKVELSGSRTSGWHSAYRRSDHQLVIEWLEYQDPAPYDHATKIIFTAEQELALMRSYGLTDAAGSKTAALADRFTTYWAVRAYADQHSLAYASEVDFHP